MQGTLAKYLVGGAFLMHGLGMIGGSYFVFTTRSWFAQLFGSMDVAAKIIVAILWIVSGVAFVGAAWGFFTEMSWWREWAIVAAPVSLAGIVLWAGQVPPGTYVGAALDVAVIAYLLFRS